MAVPVNDSSTIPVYSRAGGTRDLDPETTARRDHIEARLFETFACYGFQRVDVPTLEYRDLYSPSRMGPDLFHHLVMARLPASSVFPPDELPETTDNPLFASLKSPGEGQTTHDAALRPDFTAPLARMLVTRMLGNDNIRRELPARWSYAGSVFRARSPRPLRLLEFRQAGVELLGARHAYADLEVLALACDVTTRLQVPDWRLHLGHAELFRALVDLVSGNNDASRDVLANGLVQASRVRTRASLGDDGFARYLEGSRKSLTQRVRDFLTVPGESSHSARIDRLLEAEWPELVAPDSISLDLWRSRLPELQERLFRRIWTENHGIPTDRTEALLALSRSAGEPESFFEGVGRFVAALAPSAPPYVLEQVKRARNDFRALTRELRSALGTPVPLVATPAASRGIAYYTGMTFEIHTPATGTAYSDICGGGRYDRLHRWLYRRAEWTAALRRGEPVSEAPTLSPRIEDALTGVGFAFGVERLDAALRYQVVPRRQPDAYIIVQDADFSGAAFHAAQRLRRAGLSVLTELPDNDYTVRSLEAQLGAASHAGGRGARYALIFGAAEQRTGHVALKDLATRQQTTLSLDEAEAVLLATQTAPVCP